nr:MAG TPA: hypothetical protein [Caudoviricetes sp.]
MRLIDSDKFILALMDASLSSVDEDTILDLVDSIPTVDAVPVVRCKDCIHGFFHNSSGGMYCCTSPAGLSLQTPNAFCCYGERKEEPHDRLQKDL